MPHEPSDSCPPLQPAADRRCAACRMIRPLDDFPAQTGMPTSRCVTCRHRRAAVARRHRQRALRQVARQAEAGYRALLTHHRGVVGMRPECQCLACAQLQHHQANDTLLLVAIGTILVVGGLVWLAGLLASGTWPEVPLVELPGILARLRDHMGDPAAAWPAGAHDRLPGPVGMYATLAAILVTPLALGVLAWWLHQPPAPPRPPATAAGRRRRALPPATHPDLPMLLPPEHDWEAR
jgi:hypothetical protein